MPQKVWCFQKMFSETEQLPAQHASPSPCECLCVFRQCEVCNSSLGYLKAGDSMWIYKRMVHCENCFGVTRGKMESLKMSMAN